MTQPWKFDRSRQRMGRFCKRAEYLQYYHDGTGYVPVGLNIDQFVGQVTHEILARVIGACRPNMPTSGLIGNVVENTLRDARREMAESLGDREYDWNVFERELALAEGMARGWIRHRLPDVLKAYEIVEVEREIDIPMAEGIILMSRLDARLVRKSDETAWALEFKTTGMMSDGYVESWRYSSQTLIHAYVIEKFTGLPAAGVLMEFLYKGVKRKDSNEVEQRYSPFVRGYKLPGTSLTPDQVSYSSTTKKGWASFDTWREPSTVEAWVEGMPVEVLTEQFANIEVFRSPAEMRVWEEQTLVEQRQARLALHTHGMTAEDEAIKLLVDWPCRLDEECADNKYHRKCPYLPVCFGQVEMEAMGECGMYRPRRPHHEQEVD